MPENVKWVKVLYLSLEVNRDAFRGAATPPHGAHEPGALGAHPAPHGRIQRPHCRRREPLWKLYDEGINPATRS